jgi:anthranilate/para-aminobenzoate synthase component I
MNEIERQIQQARSGQIVPIVREIDIRCPVDFFSRLTDYGRKKHSCLLESRDYLSASSDGELTFGTAQPALYLTGTADKFRIEALTATGKRILKYLAAKSGLFDFCETIEFGQDCIAGIIRRPEGTLDEQTRLKSTNQMDVIRAVGFAFELASKPFRITCGLLGAISYDFIDQFEKLPANRQDILGNPDYEMYFADNIFLMDHKKGQGYVVVNAIITNGDREQVYRETMETFDYYFQKAKEDAPTPFICRDALPPATTDTPQADYEDMVLKAKQHILDGDVFQVVLSRTHIEPCPAEPLDVYRKLRKLNPSPYIRTIRF